ncbi:bleomycin hydrolase [Homalodisca vitripennis]|nr:bleomycin hydrolase [Homalodisca vitripennis]
MTSLISRRGRLTHMQSLTVDYPEFAPPGDWIHLDIAGVMGPADNLPYLQKGMTGRPTRTLIQLLIQSAEC